jgi:hypothetical protein
MIEFLAIGTGALLLYKALSSSGASTPATPTRFDYVSREGDRFAFELEKQSDGKLRAYILEAPSFGGRADDGHSTHRLFEPGRGHYVCVRDDLQPTNLDEARDWARYWADGASRYIKTGKEFS